MITGFVAVMMMLVEYVNVLTRGTWQKALAGSRWRQYVVAALLGATPGCLGAFVIGTLFIHRTVSLGAVVACMIATSGDEAFVMLATFPRTAALLSLGLAGIGALVGRFTDVVSRSSAAENGCSVMVIHDEEDQCRCFDAGLILLQLKHLTLIRGVLICGSGLFLVGIGAGVVGPSTWGWIRISLLAVAALTLFVVATTPDHFLEKHLWRHVVLQHVRRIFLWIIGVLVVISLLRRFLDLGSFVQENSWLVLILAGTVGIVPESGPHLLFVTLFDDGSLPLSVLVTSSIVQDGHGMLPVLAHSWRSFMKIKSVNLVIGLLIGALMLSLGW
jgi:hypothetical protein